MKLESETLDFFLSLDLHHFTGFFSKEMIDIAKMCPLVSFVFLSSWVYEVTINTLRFDNANHEKLTKHEVCR